ncbi:hypothetical protein AALO_G00066870 [Alosa alosa]|uniref:Uncharacterized protein n=1 Tax=Alosa alosa TaxID=278164 RepID=A0AAV6H118_9TELE|nr:hypothetical protein AALO_G00066870 [Alosa alosa]
MEDSWGTVISVVKVWFSLVVGLIMLPSMFGLSLGITERYMTILIKTLKWATMRIQKGVQEQETLKASPSNGIIQRDDGSMEQEIGELRHGRPRTQEGGRLHPQRRLLLQQERHRDHRGGRGHPEVHVRGAGLLEPADAHQLQLPVHQPAAHHLMGNGSHGALLHPSPSESYPGLYWSNLAGDRNNTGGVFAKQQGEKLAE